MRDLLNILLFAADDGGAGGGAGDGGDGGAGDDAAAAAAGAGDAGNGGGGAGDGGDPPAFYRPEGLPDSMLGKDERETMDKMAKALNGYRDRDAKVKVPEDAGEYFKFADDQPEEIRPYLAEIAGDDMSKPMADFLKAEKIPVETFQKIASKFVSLSSEMGLMEPPIDIAAERAALLPEAAKHLPADGQKQAIETRMNENFAYIDSLVGQNGGLSKDAAEYAKAMLGDSAKGHQFFEFMQKAMGRAGGGGPALNDLGGDSQKTVRAQLQAELAKPENRPDHPKFDKAQYDALMARYEKEIG